MQGLTPWTRKYMDIQSRGYSSIYEPRVLLYLVGGGIFLEAGVHRLLRKLLSRFHLREIVMLRHETLAVDSSSTANCDQHLRLYIT